MGKRNPLDRFILGIRLAIAWKLAMLVISVGLSSIIFSLILDLNFWEGLTTGCTAVLGSEMLKHCIDIYETGKKVRKSNFKIYDNIKEYKDDPDNK